MEEIRASLQQLLGQDIQQVNAWQMALRALITYVASLVMVRVGEKRFMGQYTAFDLLLGFILGSVVSRAINGSAPFLPTLAAGFVLVGLHWAMAMAAFRWSRFGTLVKGNPRLLVEGGEILWDAMQKSHISRSDLMEALRLQGRVSDLSEVREARLERNGNISVLRTSGEHKVLQVRVEEGIQTVRIQVE